jgi:hypothetical protein
MTDKRIEDLNNLYNDLLTNRKNYETNWQDTAKYFRPLKTDITSEKTAGDKKDLFVANDSTMVVALENFASILNGTLTNKATPWFTIKVENEELKNDDQILEYLKAIADKMWNVLYDTKGNFEDAHHENLKDFGTFGTIALKIEEGKTSLINFKAIHIKNILITENDEGKVDTCILLMKMTAKDIVKKFADGGNIDEVIKKASIEKPNTNFDIRLYIMPRNERDSTKIDTINMPFQGIWLDPTHSKIINETGFNSFPVAVGRSAKGTGEVYGTGQAMYALADARSLNRMWYDYFESIQKILNPPLIVNAQFEKQLNLQPRALNMVKSPVGNGRAVEPINDSKGVNPAVELITQKQESIRKIFFLDKLSVLDDPRATATQILELRAESYRIMGSLASSLQQYLESILDRVFDILFKLSYAQDDNFTLLPDAPFPEMPNKMKGTTDATTGKRIFPKMKIEFINPVNQANQLGKNNSVDAFLMSIMNLAQANPAILDTVDFDEIARYKADILQIDPKLIKNADKVDEERQARQQQVSQQQEMVDANTEAQTLATIKQAGI